MIIADSGADTEFTGRHPAPCKKKNVHANMPLSGGAFFMGKKCPNGFGQ
ncbi:hypothetical protein OkiPb00406_51420 [Escherichia coli]|nr:hypothetical protein ECO111_2034 [Escherichia coli O111:H- str. 11128]